MMTMKNKTVMITGASAGIGEACARVFAEAGARLILLARRKEKIDALALELKEKYGTESYLIGTDVRNQLILDKVLGMLPYEWDQIDVLINNAGLARGFTKIQDGLLSDWEEMIDSNIKGLLYVSRIILPKMIEAGKGTVINIGSIAGREAYPMGNVYCGSKAAVRAISKGMNIDLNGTGVRATDLEPGLVETEFALVRFRGDGEKAANV
ncbi:MAG: SDR family NAD(P)-dependent oxidoreductase, partial [Chlorobi bacterium]|nr:SDR family NAD(P)-dependent oxidoreductase [Chlorobiota bacterium]